jgi:7,8-dihydro-6-hydroxymethylpterin-pyrophosphokinase
LLEFYEKLKTYNTSKHYELEGHNGDSHTSYLAQFIKIADALEDKLYLRACNEMELLVYREPIFQNRIHCNLIYVLEKHFKIHSDDV